MQWGFVLDKEFYACERGNTWLMEADGSDRCHVAWFKLDDNHWLEVAVEPPNIPGFKVAVMEETEAELAEHINSKCQGWIVNKCNVDGVKIDEDGTVEWGEDEEEEKEN